MKNKVKKTIQWIAISLIAIMPLIPYFYTFHQPSDDPNDWSAFGSYIGGVYSIIVAFLILFLTRRLEQKDRVLQEKRDAAKKLFDCINSINNSQVSLNSLVKTINTNALYLPDKLVSKLIKLYDSYVSSSDKTGNKTLLSEVISELKDIYNE